MEAKHLLKGHPIDKALKYKFDIQTYKLLYTTIFQ